MSNETFVEYKVRPVTRYVVSRFSKDLSPCRTGELVESSGSETRGEHDNADVAYEVAYALCKADHDRLGWPLDDERIQYPRHPRESAVADETKMFVSNVLKEYDQGTLKSQDPS